MFPLFVDDIICADEVSVGDQEDVFKPNLALPEPNVLRDSVVKCAFELDIFQIKVFVRLKVGDCQTNHGVPAVLNLVNARLAIFFAS